MGDTGPISYTPDELLGYLPNGWRLGSGADSGRWDPGRKAWLFTVRDGSDLDWPVAVEAARAAELGRFEALRRSLDDVVRHRRRR